MSLPDAVRIQALLSLFTFCDLRTPDHLKHEYRLALRSRKNTFTVYECYGPWNPKFPKSSRRPLAQFRYDPDQQVWTLYAADEKERWYPYKYAKPTPDLTDLITMVDIDPSGTFFGE